MKKFLFHLIACFLFLPVSVHAGTGQYITLEVPEAVIARAITAMLPLNIDAHSKNIRGDITILDISELQLSNRHLACRLHLAGNNLAFLTEIAGHEIRLKVGSVEIDFRADAALRFDARKQLLYIKPVIRNVSAKGDGRNGEIGQALIGLLNGREFPVTIQELDPIIARTGTKTVIISTKITDIQARKDHLQFRLTPAVGVKNP